MQVLGSEYKFDDRVLAAYATFSQQIKKFNYQLGLRVESSKYTGALISKSQQFGNEYPLSLFPSVFATYKLTNKQDIQLNYSRKINRPNFFQIIPFIDYTDSLNITRGNPGLVPEFTNSMELSYQNQLKTGHSLLASIYYKNTENLIARYQYRDKNPDASKSDSIIIGTYANASQSYTYGLELTGKDKIASWWDVTSNINFFYATLKAGNIAGGLSSEQFSWFAKVNNNFKLPANYSIQLTGDYQAKTLVPQSNGGGGGRGGGPAFGGGANLASAQGYANPIYGVDIAVKKTFLKANAASLTLQVSDIFRTRYNSTHSSSPYFIQDYSRIRDAQVVRLNFNWRFGKMDVSLFKRKNRKADTDNIDTQGAGGQ
ncbi:MAG: TonB-dependent receptor [Sphingobacteriales bacterium]|nr:TonB-dependent receptor [Sphingobacteriales bacterium]